MFFPVIPKLYKGFPIIIAGIGPSLTSDVIEIMRKYRDTHVILGINDAYKIIDFMDDHYACDARWWKVHGEIINKKYPDLRLWCHDEEGEKYGAIKVTGKTGSGLSTDPTYIHTGLNSGFQALNLAYHWGCSKIILVGYNMGGLNGKNHFFEGREKTLSVSSPYPQFAEQFGKIQPDIKDIVVNCTRRTQLKAFRIGNLEEECSTY